MCASARETPCASRAVDALVCYLGQDLRLARDGVFDEERYFVEQLSWKVRARRVVADEALRRERESLTCEDLEHVGAAQIRLDAEEADAHRERARMHWQSGAAAGSSGVTSSATDEPSRAAPNATSPPPVASPTSVAPVPSAPTYDEAASSMRDVIDAFESLDVLFASAIPAIRRRDLDAQIRIVLSIAAWKANRWASVERSLGILARGGCDVPEPTRTLTCGFVDVVLATQRAIDAPGESVDPRDPHNPRV